jgi:hypothetical protein
MATPLSLFLKATRQDAHGHGLTAHALPDDKGLLLVDQGLAVAEQCRMLTRLAAELKAEGAAAAAPPPEPAAGGPSMIDCQVSVEERAQLFKFLTG